VACQTVHRRIAGDAWQAHGFVFTASEGQPLQGARASWERVCAKAGLGELKPEIDKGAWRKLHPHGPLPKRRFRPAFRIYDLRHTFATQLVANGVPLHVVAKLLGHSPNSVMLLKRYLHASPDQRAGAVQTLDVLFKTA